MCFTTRAHPSRMPVNDLPDLTSRLLVWLAEVPWDGVPQRHHHLVHGLAKRWRVVFVEPPARRRLPRRGARWRDSVRVVQALPLVNATVAPVRILMRSRPARRLSGKLTAEVVRRLAGQRPEIVVCSNVYFAEAARALRPKLCVLDVCDDPRHFPDAPAWMEELLGRALRWADVVTTSGRFLQAELERLGGRPVRLVANGVGRPFLDTPATVAPPRDRTVVGCLGYWASWVDFDLLRLLASSLRELDFEFIGPIDRDCALEVRRLEASPNVRFTGFLPTVELPSRLDAFQVAIIPFKRSALTEAMNVNKLYEYAARNLPIVSTAFSSDLEPFAGSVDICQGADDFVRTVEERARGFGRRETRWIAEEHRWDAIADCFSAIVAEAFAEADLPLTECS